MRYVPALVVLLALAAVPARGWEFWGGDPGGQRFAKLDQITPANVGNLVRADALAAAALALLAISFVLWRRRRSS